MILVLKQLHILPGKLAIWLSAYLHMLAPGIDASLT